jgi:hypothetical protein
MRLTHKLTLLLAVPALAAGCSHPKPAVMAHPVDAAEQHVTPFCGGCHKLPPADTFPRRSWLTEVKQGYQFNKEAGNKFPEPPMDEVVHYFESRAPEQVALLTEHSVPDPCPIQFDHTGYREPDTHSPPGIGNVSLGHLYSKTKLDVIACDIKSGPVYVLSPYAPHPALKRIATLEHPAHAEVVDLNGDGIPDLIVADIGVFLPADARLGRVVWLRGNRDGTFTPFTLLNGVGRVADAQVADLDGDGKPDIVVGEFGHHRLGSVIALMNRTIDWEHPVFEPHVIEHVTGSIHVPICDLDHDGKPDIVAVQSQEHEQVVAYLNRGGGSFERKLIYAAPHPDYGSSGIQVIDMNGNGKLDVLYTHGDLYDPHTILRADQGVDLLENTGTFPFVDHPLARMYGTYRAVAGHFSGSSMNDVVVVSNVTPGKVNGVENVADFDSVLLLHQTAPGKFVRYTLERGLSDHFSCAAGDIFGDGKIDFVTGTFIWSPAQKDPFGVTVFRNRGMHGTQK